MRGTGADISQTTTPLCHKEEKQRNIVVLSGKMGDERVGAISNEVDGGGGGIKKARVGMSLPDPSPLPPLKSAAFGTSIRGGEQKPRNCCWLFRPPSPLSPTAAEEEETINVLDLSGPPIYDLPRPRSVRGGESEVFISKSAAIYCGANAATLALTVFLKKEKDKRKRNSISCQEEEGKT